jgi:multiple sugar transport system permease protein/putative chitobiose transport system permease protein
MRRRRGATILLTTAAALVAVSVFLPLWWVFASSMRPGNSYVENMTPLSWLAFIPVGGDFTNYEALGSGAFLLGLFNSFLVAGLTILVGLAIAIPAAYALATIEFRGRGLIFSFVIIVAMIPFDAIAIPLSSLFQGWGLSDSYAGLVLPALANGFAIFVLRQFFMGVPTERQLAPIVLANLSTAFTVDLGQILAGSFVLSVIPMVLLLFFQKQYTESLSTTGLKG